MFEAGNSKVTEGDGLAAQQSFGPAAQAYQDAESRYAGGRAALAGRRGGQGCCRPGKGADDRGEAAGAPGCPRVRAPAAQERQATQPYQRAAFKEASESFAVATELSAKAAARPPERPRPVPADEVRGVLDSYVRAFETKDLGLDAKELRPGSQAG